MIKLFEVQELIVSAVSSDSAFNVKVAQLLKGNMKYSIDQNEIESQDEYPIFIVHKNAKIEDNEDGSQRILQFIIAAALGMPEDLPSSSVRYYPSIRDIEILADDALELIKSVVCTQMNYSLAHTNSIITTIGEADDVQIAVSFRLEKDNFI